MTKATQAGADKLAEANSEAILAAESLDLGPLDIRTTSTRRTPWRSCGGR